MEMQLKCTAIMKDTETWSQVLPMVPVTILPKGAACSLAKRKPRLLGGCGCIARAEKRAKKTVVWRVCHGKMAKKRRSKHFISFHKFCRVIIIDNLCCCNEMARPVIPPCAVQAVERNLSSGQRARGHLRLGWTGTHRNCPIHTHTCICI